MSSGRRTMLPTLRPFAKRSPEQTCGLWRPRPSSSRAAWCSIARAICSSASRPQWLMRSARILPSLASSHQSAAMVLNNCSMWSPTQVTNGCLEIARACVLALGAQLRTLKVKILNFDRQIMAWHRSNEARRRLDEIPGVGPALATALVASVADPKAFRSGRNFSAWIGLVPKQHSSGGKDKLGSISKQGDRYLRSLFTAGALAVIRYAKIHGSKH